VAIPLGSVADARSAVGSDKHFLTVTAARVTAAVRREHMRRAAMWCAGLTVRRPGRCPVGQR
jgi:hypothetical protein